MNMLHKKLLRNQIFLLIPVVAVMGKLLFLFVLPDKYKYDSWRVLGMINSDTFESAWAGGYIVARDFFRKINFFRLTGYNGWNIYLGIIGTLIISVILTRVKQAKKIIDFPQAGFILATAAVMNIYVFVTSKDFLQFCYTTLLCIVLCLPAMNISVGLKQQRMNVDLRSVPFVLVLVWSSQGLREYYSLVAGLTVVIYGMLIFDKARFHREKKMSSLKFAITLLFVVLVIMAIAKTAMPEAYAQIMDVSDDSYNEWANTAITRFFDNNGNIGMFMLNYVTSAARMMLPVELMIRNPMYWIFAGYQFLVSYYVYKGIVHGVYANATEQLALSGFVAYIMTSFIFEPDFGSWIRHESTMTPLLFFVIFSIDSGNAGRKENDARRNTLSM